MDENKIMNLMEDIEYGWIDKDGNKHIKDFDTFSDDYVLQSPEEVIKNKVGVCWDQVELERYYFNDRQVKTFFIVHYDDDKCPTHTFLVYVKDHKFCWFEHSWEIFKGIHEYDTFIDLIIDVRNKFIEHELHNKFEPDNLCINEYTKPEYGISVEEFYKHCDSGREINIDKILHP